MIKAYCDKCGDECTDTDAAKFVSLSIIDSDSFEPEGTMECLGMFCGNCVHDVLRVLKGQKQ